MKLDEQSDTLEFLRLNYRPIFELTSIAFSTSLRATMQQNKTQLYQLTITYKHHVQVTINHQSQVCNEVCCRTTLKCVQDLLDNVSKN